MRKSLLGDPRVVGKKSQNLSCWLACGSWGGGRTAQLAPHSRPGGRLEEDPERRGGEQGCTSRLRKGVAAGEKLETLAPLGSRTVQHSHSAGEAPNTLLSLLALGPLLSASGSRSCPRVPRPSEVTPTALIIFCFAPGLFSTTNFQQSPWRRAGGREGGGGGGGCCSDPRPELRSSPG